MITIRMGRDKNGNKIVTVSGDGFRGFSVQTLGNMPTAHSQLHDANARNVHDLVRENVRFTHCVLAARGPEEIPRKFIIVWSELRRYVEYYGTPYQRKALGIEQ